MIRYVPNVITGLRIVLSVAMLFFVRQPVVCLVLYLLCGASDVLDGFIARRYGVSTQIGAKLDSAADFVFYAVSIVMLFLLTQGGGRWVWLGIVLGITAFKGINLLLTKRLHGQWASMHTIANKASGLLVFIALPLCVLLGRMPWYITLLLALAALYASVEELLILLRPGPYNINRRSIFTNS